MFILNLHRDFTHCVWARANLSRPNKWLCRLPTFGERLRCVPGTMGCGVTATWVMAARHFGQLAE
jgi:hypothetical protein